MLRKIFLGVFATAMVLAIVYMLGPKTKKEDLIVHFPEVPTRLSELEKYVHDREDSVIGLKEGNEAYIQWADSLNKRKTPYSIIYIHGFGAGPMEGDPVHRFLGEHFGANVFVTRLPDHGIRRANGMEYVTAQKLADATGEAYQIGKSLGDSVIVVGTSMGGALTLLLASQQPEIASVILYSPAIRDNGERLSYLFKPWAKVLMKSAMTTNGVVDMNRTGEKAQYWSEIQHFNAYESLGILMYSAMNSETFAKIKQPLFLGYYYKNDQEQDRVVSVPKMLEMFGQLGTPENLKKEQAFPKSGDHVIASSITSNDWQGVLFASIDFLENVVGVRPNPKYQEQVEEMAKAKSLVESLDQE